MKTIKNKEHDFAAKLKQKSTVNTLKTYINWRKNISSFKTGNPAPISINLDLTSACNFACPFCVDSGIINTGKFLTTDNIKKTIDVLSKKGLLSVILLGGGEPTLHKDFQDIVKHIKSKNIQVGIVTNGTRLDKVIKMAHLLKKKDWVRLSIDAATQETFIKLHNPKTKTTLSEIMANAKTLKETNGDSSLGFSFVIVWEGVNIEGNELPSNISEIAQATKLAADHLFDYISFKPCLIRLSDTQKESLLYNVDSQKQARIANEISDELTEAKKIASNKIKILESVNLKAILTQQAQEIKKQPKNCHLQFFRTVLTPSGIYHCPAFRGLEKAKIADQDGYSTEEKFNKTFDKLKLSIDSFKAHDECCDVGCFYHDVNWWIENFLTSSQSIDKIESLEDDNFFL